MNAKLRFALHFTKNFLLFAAVLAIVSLIGYGCLMVLPKILGLHIHIIITVVLPVAVLIVLFALFKTLSEIETKP